MVSPAPLVAPHELAAELSGPAPPLLLDVRWRLGRSDGRAEHERARIDGARYVDLESELCGPRRPGSGRHPLPEPAALARAAAGWGVRPGRRVVAYDDAAGLSAARLWWLLRFAGHDDVAVLDGGLAGWVTAGLPVAGGPPPAGAGAGEAAGDGDGHPALAGAARAGMAVLDADAAQRLARSGLLLDARAGERYRGEQEPVDPVAGHIPGAISAPTTENLGPDGRFLPVAELRERFGRLGVLPGVAVGVYCGSGVTAAHEILALELAGLSAALYPGSWSEWVSDAARPVATGPQPG